MLFALILGSAIAAAAALRESLGDPVSFAAAIAFAAVSAAILERIHPAVPDWNRSRGDLRSDLAWSALNAIAQPAIGGAMWLTAAAVAPEGARLWPREAPLAAQVAAALLVRELLHYWLHRITHERGGILWRFHSIHHEPERLYWLNASRIHPGNVAADAAVGLAPLLVLGVPADALFFTGLLVAVVNVLQHANIAMRLGPLNRVFSAGEPHRWHHERTARPGNYGDALSVWDAAFGTFRLPPGSPNSIGR